MEFNENYELILNHISYGESVLRKDEDYDNYRQMARLFLNHKHKHLFAEDILNKYSEGTTLEKLFSQSPGQYVQGVNLPNPKNENKREKTWYDTWAMENIEPEDTLFDFFFACKLRQVDLLKVDDFLNYQLDRNFEGDADRFKRFLVILARKHKELIGTAVMDTVNEWMSSLAKPALPVVEQAASKARIKRTADDMLTSLNLEQTALLVYLLQESNIILKGDFINNKKAGEAFSILTGFSPDTLRQEIGSPRKNKKNLSAVYNVIYGLSLMIDKQIKGR